MFCFFVGAVWGSGCVWCIFGLCGAQDMCVFHFCRTVDSVQWVYSLLCVVWVVIRSRGFSLFTSHGVFRGYGLVIERGYMCVYVEHIIVVSLCHRFIQ